MIAPTQAEKVKNLDAAENSKDDSLRRITPFTTHVLLTSQTSSSAFSFCALSQNLAVKLLGVSFSFLFLD